jgi:hypothetical protein
MLSPRRAESHAARVRMNRSQSKWVDRRIWISPPLRRFTREQAVQVHATVANAVVMGGERSRRRSGRDIHPVAIKAAAVARAAEYRSSSRRCRRIRRGAKRDATGQVRARRRQDQQLAVQCDDIGRDLRRRRSPGIRRPLAIVNEGRRLCGEGAWPPVRGDTRSRGRWPGTGGGACSDVKQRAKCGRASENPGSCRQLSEKCPARRVVAFILGVHGFTLSAAQQRPGCPDRAAAG